MAYQETILIADDAEINRAILRGLFEGEYNLLEAENGEQALMLLHQHSESVAAVLLDLVMPEKDGYEVLEEMQQSKLLFQSPVVVITSEDSMDNRVKVFELGASDIIAKPFEPAVVKSRVKNLIELGRYRRRLEALVEEQSNRMNETNIAVIDMLSSVIEYRSLESGQHIRRIRLFTKILLEEVAGNCQEYHLDARKIRLITESSSMHDIGKIAIPDSILNKPGKLSPEEFEIMKTHSVKGCEILMGLDRLQDPEYLQYAYNICRYHHERWDGRGYPDGLKENSIPICAQVVALADCYDALTTDRVYKKAITPARAFDMILNGECGAFSPRILECFKNVRESFAHLSQEYRDVILPDRVSSIQAVDPVWEVTANTSKQDQLKYFTLLRYLDCTVMEADLNTGICRLMYLADQSLSSLRSGSSFEDSIRAFADTSVHPEDRKEVLHILDSYTKELFDEGMLWRDRHYRILDCGTNSYVMYRASIQRIDLDNPRQHRIMLIWRREDDISPSGYDIQSGANSLENNPFINHLFGGIHQCCCDRHFTLQKICKNLIDISGYTEQEIKDKFNNRLMELIYPDDRERVTRQFRNQRCQGTLLESEYRLMTKSGGIAWISSRCVVVKEQRTEVSYGVLTDITQSRQAKEELRLSQERHHIIMDQTNDIIFEWDLESDKLYLSSNWYDQYGYAPVTRNVREEIPRISHIHQEDMPAFTALMDAVSAGVPYKETNFRIADAAGRYRWRRVRASAQFDLNGKPFRAVGVILDIDEQKKESGKQRYEHLFQSVLCGIVQYRLDGRKVIFKNANQEAIRLFGYSQEEFWEKQDWDLADLIAEEDREYILKASSGLSQAGEKKTYEYRLRQKDGTACWIIGSAEVILDNDGEQVIQSVYLDIDDRKKAEKNSQRLADQMEASNEILHRALEHTANCEFYYYPQTMTCTVPERTCSIMHCRKYYDQMPEQFALDQVAEEYRPSFYAMYQSIHSGERTASCEFRSLDSQCWHRQTMSVIQSNEEGAPQFVIGIMENITHQKEMENALKEARSHDQLTGLYNKDSGIRLIQDYLAHKRQTDEVCTLMLIGMDDFETINQVEGNVFADVILQEAADLILAETEEDAVQVRVSGDEFMVFMKHCDSERGNQIGSKISARMKHILNGSDHHVRTAASVGICSTNVSEEYSVLCRCAECALKFVKEHDKGNAFSYSDITEEQERYLTRLNIKDDPSDPIDQKSLYKEQDLVSFAIELLGSAKNLNDAVNLLLSRIGKQYHFDRVSILESNRSYLTYYFAYQWARNRSSLQLGQKFYVTQEDFEDCSNMYDEEGLADHNLRDSISDIASCLHAGIWDYGEYVGSMSFEIDQKNYRWTGEQRKLLKELVKIVPSFIMKSKADALSRAKTDFLSRMSHEIRTPMNAINGMTTIAKQVLGDQEKTRECLEKIESANEYLLSLINDILDMDKIESGRLEISCEPMPLLQLMDGLESMFRLQAEEKGLKLVFINDYKKSLQICADRLRLNQILTNIIGNAIKFTEQGSITVCVEHVKTELKTQLYFSIRDTGIGIEPGARDRIFYSFEQAKPGTSSVYGGTGLGLAISYRLVQAMGGSLKVSSEVGRGSEFFFTLTFDTAAYDAGDIIEEDGTEDQTMSPVCMDSYTILLVEDNEMNREIAQTLLEMNNFIVVCAVNGQDALDRFCASEPGTFDAILMDIRMPVMDGLESTRRIRMSERADARKIPIIALTANAFDEDTRKSMASGMNGHLTKPFQIERMVELLKRFINKEP